jgi:hypothetical protein
LRLLVDFSDFDAPAHTTKCRPLIVPGSIAIWGKPAPKTIEQADPGGVS